MTILARMAAALEAVDRHWSGKRKPKAFYLSPPDWDEFCEVVDERVGTGSFSFGNNPVKERTDPTFNDVPVRPSRSATSRLYDHTASGRDMTPRLDGAGVPLTRYPRSDIPAPAVFAALDAISRTRALTERESRVLEAAMKGRNLLTTREAARLGIKRRPQKRGEA